MTASKGLLSRALSFAVCVALSVLTTPSSAGSNKRRYCDFTDIDVDNVVDQVVSHMTKHVEKDDSSFDELGLFGLGQRRLSSLENMRRYGPVLAFCEEDTRKIHFNAINSMPMFYRVRWFADYGIDGAVIWSAESVRVDIDLVVQGLGTNATVTKGDGAVIAHAQGVSISLEGTGTVLNSVVAIFSTIFSPMLRNAWADAFEEDLEKSLGQALLCNQSQKKHN